MGIPGRGGAVSPKKTGFFGPRAPRRAEKPDFFRGNWPPGARIWGANAEGPLSARDHREWHSAQTRPRPGP